MECIYFDKNSIVWEFPREMQDSLFFTGNNEMFNLSLIHISEPTRPY